MKILIAIILILTYSVSNAQIEVTTPAGGPYYIITMDSTFYYSTEDSTLVIADSLATIKFLVGLAIENMKEEARKRQRKPSFNSSTAILNYRKRL